MNTIRLPAFVRSCAIALCLPILMSAWGQQSETNSPHVTYMGPNVVVWSASDGMGTNWGPTSAGFRLGIRLQKDSFTNSEPIEATVTLQNVTNVYLTAIFDVPSYQEEVLLNNHGQQLQIRPELRPKSPFEAGLRNIVDSPKDLPIAPGGEAKLNLRVDTMYDVSAPGTYQVYFRLTLPREDREPSGSNVVSGKAFFHVLPPRKPAEDTH
jgi:hypothetical protein